MLVASEDRPVGLIIRNFINAFPEPDFKYFSKETAFSWLIKTLYHTKAQGVCFAVYIDFPSLCIFKRFSILSV